MKSNQDLLLTGPDFYSYADSIKRELERRGYSVNFFSYPELESHRYYIINGWAELKTRTIGGENTINEYDYWADEITEYNTEIIKRAREEDIDVFFSLKGNLVFPDTVKEIAAMGATTILWCYDSAQRLRNVLDAVPHYHQSYFFEKSDLDVIPSDNASFLPMGYDSEIFRPLDIEKELDIVFIGRMYDKRKYILGEVVNSFPECSIQIWSKEWNWYNPLLFSEYVLKRRELGNRMTNKNISPKESNIKYNRSKICLNIHHGQQSHSLNPRSYEILGSGGFQLVDHRKMIDEQFEDGEHLVSYSSIEDLISKVKYYLKNDDERTEIAQSGYRAVINNDDFSSRIERIVSETRD